MPEKVYFDTCALNRLTDNPAQARIRDEAEAVTQILDLITDGQLKWIGSSVLRLELSQNPDVESREISLAYLELSAEIVSPNERTYERASVLELEGFGAFDALHLALAETAGVDWLLSVDDRFVTRAEKAHKNLQPVVINPLDMDTKEAFMASETLAAQMTDEQLERHAFKVLAKELGLGGLARFIRLNCSGRGDYTASRTTWQAGMTVVDIRRELERTSSKI